MNEYNIVKKIDNNNPRKINNIANYFCNFVADIEESGNNNIQITTIAPSTIVMDNDDDSIDFDDI